MGRLKQYEIEGALVEVDEAATKAWYAQAEEWGCECTPCRNYLAAVEGELPQALTELLDKLGISPRKATEVCMLHDEDGKVLYKFCFRMAGRILRQAKEEDGTWGLCTDDPLWFDPFGAVDFPEPQFDLHVFYRLPWVLNEPIRCEGSADL